MTTRGTLFLHGYGVRGQIWDTLRAALGSNVGRTAAPDVEATDADDLQRAAREAAMQFSGRIDGSLVLVGHSLGSALAALVAQQVGPPTIAGAVLIAPPYGERTDRPGPIMRFLLRHRLIPPALLRPRFFSHHTPIEIQREVFANAVPEAPGVQELSLQRRFFHTDLINGPLPVPSLVIASERDRIVPVDQSRRFGELLGSRLMILPAREGVGHDDFFASPEIAARTAGIIAEFASGLR